MRCTTARPFAGVGIDLACEAAPDATTLLKFCRRLEAHGLTGVIFQAINAHLAEQGLLLREAILFHRRPAIDASCFQSWIWVIDQRFLRR